MKKITAYEFKMAIELDPAWASKLTEPVEITDYCNCRESKITHLSTLLHFTGKNEGGTSASFELCTELKVAEGNFKYGVGFAHSHIEEIGQLICGKDHMGQSVYFEGCDKLKVATGTYPGAVNFSYAGIQKIENLTCGKNREGDSAWFRLCENLKEATGTYEGYVEFSDTTLEEIKNIKCGKNKKGNSASFWRNKNLKVGTGTYEGHVNFAQSGVEKFKDLTCGENEDGLSINLAECHNLVEADTNELSELLKIKPSNIRADEALAQQLKRLRGQKLLQKMSKINIEIAI